MQIARRAVIFASETPAARFTFASSKRPCISYTSDVVYNEVTTGPYGSNIWWRGKSYAPSVRSEIPSTQKSWKRVPKDERKAMIESFVDSYKATNAGKFPSISVARKHVGGSHYMVRKIMQELEYKSRISPLDKTNSCLMRKDLSSRKVEEISGSQMKVDDAHVYPLQKNEGSQTSCWVEETLSEEGSKLSTTRVSSGVVATKSHNGKEEVTIDAHQCLEKVEASSKEALILDAPEHKSPQHQELYSSVKLASETSGKQTNDEEFPKRLTLWGNLMSFAHGIFHVWRKQ